MLSPRDHVRAALIAVVLLVHGIAASPLPRSVKRSQFESAIAKEELDRWVGLLGAAWVTVTRAELADRSFAFGEQLVALRTFLLGPVRPWFRVSGTGQSWGLFTYPDSWPHQLVVEIRVGKEWRTVFAGLDEEADWSRALLAYRRVRGVYDGNTYRPTKTYEHFAKWIGGRALADFPEARQARVKFIRYHTRAPGQPPDPERSEKLVRLVDR